jgi:hypothetical protein
MWYPKLKEASICSFFSARHLPSILMEGSQLNARANGYSGLPGSIWETYPFRLHKAKDVGWMPISIDDAHNGLVVRAKKCWKTLKDFDDENEPSPCLPCRGVSRLFEFRTVVERAENAKDHTPWIYLTDLQKEKLMQRMAVTIRRLRSQVHNLINLGSKLTDWFSRLIKGHEHVEY